MRGDEPHEEEITRPDLWAVRSLREARSMSPAELARTAGLAPETVERIERQPEARSASSGARYCGWPGPWR